MKRPPRAPVPPQMPPFEPHGANGRKFDWAKMTEDYLRDVNNFYRLHKVKPPDTSKPIIARRTKALLGSMNKIISRYKDVDGYGDRAKLEIGYSWIALNLVPGNSYNAMDKVVFMFFSAAIWVLDQITSQRDWESKLYHILPRNVDDLDDIPAPEVWDPSYDYDLILSVAHVLYYRDADIAPIETTNNNVKHVITNSLNASSNQHVDVPSRQRYETLISLIPKESIENAAHHFEELFWAWTDRFYACIKPLINSCIGMADVINQLGDRYNKIRSDLLKALNDTGFGYQRINQKKAGRKSFSGPKLNSVPTIDELLSKSITSKPVNEYDTMLSFVGESERSLNYALDLSDQFIAVMHDYDSCCETLSDIENTRNTFTTTISGQGIINKNACEEEYGKDVAEQMQPLLISNPYECCFALLWLIENDSDLPWLFGSGFGLMAEVIQSLPWGVREYNPFVRPEWLKEPDLKQERSSSVSQKGQSSIPNWYERKYVPTDDDKLKDFNRSLTQILYEETGCIIPRNLDNYEDCLKTIKRYGVKGKESLILLHLFSCLTNASEQAMPVNLRNELDLYQNENAESAQNNTKLTYYELNEQLRKVKEENKQLKASLHDYERSIRDVKKELASVQDTASLEHRELADLRELIFNQDSTDYETDLQEKEESDVNFPYDVVRNTVVFGGHDAWLKTIRTLLKGNIRFIDKDLASFDLSIIRNSEKIWIQPNVMSHKQYYRVVDAARLYKKPVRYFVYGSATKSAVQVVNDDI